MKNLMKFLVCALSFLMVISSAYSADNKIKAFKVWHSEGFEYDLSPTVGIEFAPFSIKCTSIDTLAGTIDTHTLKIRAVGAVDNGNKGTAVIKYTTGAYLGAAPYCVSGMPNVGFGVATVNAGADKLLLVGTSYTNPNDPPPPDPTTAVFPSVALINVFLPGASTPKYTKTFKTTDLQGYTLQMGVSMVGPFSGGDDEIRIVYMKQNYGACVPGVDPVCNVASWDYKVTYYNAFTGQPIVGRTGLLTSIVP